MLDLSHKDLEVYKISLLMVKEIYTLTKLFPREEQFVLVTQLRRAAISVSSNLAEGASRKSVKEKKRFYEISRSSLVEIDTQIEISMLLDYINQEQIIKLKEYVVSIFRMLSKIITNIELKTPLATTH
ncbi:MAG: four helix bundle protein [Ferruginibacter sp.]